MNLVFLSGLPGSGKLTSPALFRELLVKETFSAPVLPPPHVRVDTLRHASAEAAALIAKACSLPVRAAAP